MKLQIILDQDGVLADTQSELIKRYNAEYGLKYTCDDITEWDLNKIQQPNTDIQKYFLQRGFFRSLKPIKDAQEIISLLTLMGDELFVATASPIEGMVDKVLWIKKYFPFIPGKNIILINRKDMLCGDIILDDALHNLSPTKVKFPIIYDRPWNRKDGKHLIRVYNWFDFFEVVQQIRQGYNYKEIYDERLAKNKNTAM